MSEKTMTVAEAARHLSTVVESARRRHESTLLTQKGEPVARIVPVPRPKTGKELAEAWRKMRHLSPANADALEKYIAEGRAMLIPPKPPEWD